MKSEKLSRFHFYKKTIMAKRIFAISLIILVPVGFYYYFFGFGGKGERAAPKELPKLWQLPYYSFTNQNGETITSDDLKGYMYVADFFFTTCPGVCPKLSADLEKIQRDYHEKQELKLVSFTVDPMRDSVPVLKRYSIKYHADPQRWYFLTGNRDSIYKLGENGFKLPIVQDDNGQEQFTHSEKLVLVDGNGFVRKWYDGTDAGKVDSLISDIELLSIEKNK
jgi:protein SCO1